MGTAVLVNTGTTTTNVPLVSDILGKETIWIPSASLFPSTTSGCATLAQVELTALNPELFVLDYDGTSGEVALCVIRFPKSWNLGALQFRVYWTSSATDTDGIVWRIMARSFNDSDAINTAFSGFVEITDNAQSVANDLYVSAFSSDLTPDAAVADALTYIRVQRNPGHASDTMAEDGRLMGVEITFTTDALNDD